MTKSSPKTEWTEGRLRAFITSVLRGGMRKFPPKWQALEDACVGQRVNPATGRKAKFYKCAMCGGLFLAKDVEIDHVAPIVDQKTGFTTWDDFIARLYCDVKDLQVLCKPDHKRKTKDENSARTRSRAKSTGKSKP